MTNSIADVRSRVTELRAAGRNETRAGHDAPALIFNCNARGFEKSTFDPADGRPLGRKLLYPAREATPEGILAREIGVAEAYETFGSIAPAAWSS